MGTDQVCCLLSGEILQLITDSASMSADDGQPVIYVADGYYGMSTGVIDEGCLRDGGRLFEISYR